MRRLARAFAARIHKVWMWLKNQTKISTSSVAGYLSMCVYKRHLRLCDTYRNHVHWLKFSISASPYIFSPSLQKANNDQRTLLWLQLLYQLSLSLGRIDKITCGSANIVHYQSANTYLHLGQYMRFRYLSKPSGHPLLLRRACAYAQYRLGHCCSHIHDRSIDEYSDHYLALSPIYITV